MIIGLDYDGTFTSDPFLWMEFYWNCIERGHTIFVITMRYESEIDTMESGLVKVAQIFFTGRKAKRSFMLSKGIKIDVWIDDHPEAVTMDADQIWPMIAPEGQPVVPVYD